MDDTYPAGRLMQRADRSELPEQLLTVNQVVAWNLTTYRRAAALTQDQLCERTGWTKVVLSAAERSWDGKRPRQFTVDDVAQLAAGLGVPLIAMFLPPADDGIAVRYRITIGDNDGDMDALMSVVMPDTEGDSDVLGLYRDRWNTALRRYLADDPHWATLAARWLTDPEDMRVQRAARLRQRRDELLRTAAELGELADAIEDSAPASAAEDALAATRAGKTGGIIANGWWEALSDNERALAYTDALDLASRGIPGPYMAQKRNGEVTVLPAEMAIEAMREERGR